MPHCNFQPVGIEEEVPPEGDRLFLSAYAHADEMTYHTQAPRTHASDVINMKCSKEGCGVCQNFALQKGRRQMTYAESLQHSKDGSGDGTAASPLLLATGPFLDGNVDTKFWQKAWKKRMPDCKPNEEPLGSTAEAVVLRAAKLIVIPSDRNSVSIEVVPRAGARTFLQLRRTPRGGEIAVAALAIAHMT